MGRRGLRPLLAVAVVGLALFAASACTRASQDPDVTPSQPTTASSAPGLPAWHPKRPIKHATFTEAEAMKLREQWLARYAKGLKLAKVPDVALVRWTTPADVDKTLATCYTEAGFPATPVAPGGVDFGANGIPQNQVTAFNLADYTCNAEYTLHPRYTRDWTKDQKGLVYDYFVEYFVPCVAQFGITGLSAPPTRATFVEKYPSTWNPVREVAVRRPGDRVFAACPPRPPREDMYGQAP